MGCTIFRWIGNIGPGRGFLVVFPLPQESVVPTDSTGGSPQEMPQPEDQPAPDTFPDPMPDPAPVPPHDPQPPQPGEVIPPIHRRGVAPS